MLRVLPPIIDAALFGNVGADFVFMFVRVRSLRYISGQSIAIQVPRGTQRFDTHERELVAYIPVCMHARHAHQAGVCLRVGVFCFFSYFFSFLFFFCCIFGDYCFNFFVVCYADFGPLPACLPACLPARWTVCAGGRDGHGARGRAVQDVGQGLRGVDGGHQPQQKGACSLACAPGNTRGDKKYDRLYINIRTQ